MNKERQKIYALFQQNSKLRFKDIEKSIGLRSNLISYHLEKMQEEGVLEKKAEYYVLSAKAERLIPQGELAPLPVVVVALRHNRNILLIKRTKRPYQHYWALPGGKIHHDEILQEAAARIVKEKTGIEAKLSIVNAVAQETVQEKGVIKHNFILFFVSMDADIPSFKVSSHGDLQWFALSKLKDANIIPSDLWLIQHKLDATMNLTNISMVEQEGELSQIIIK